MSVSPAPVKGVSFWKRAAAKAAAVARNPVLRPVEIWALRAALAAGAGYLAKVGIDASSL